MANLSARQHATGGSGSHRPAIPEPSYAERARTLVHLNRIGSLSTLSKKHQGWPFGSVMPYGLDERGCPTFLISAMAVHTQNITRDRRASLLVTHADTNRDPLGAARVTLLGNISPVPDPEIARVREQYLVRYENARYWVDFEDFSFYRLEIMDLYFVGGFGVMGWVDAEEYYQAKPDPLAEVAAQIIDHMNTDHADALALLAQTFGGSEAEEATMTAVDRLGFHLRVKTRDRVHGMRIAFIREVRNIQEARAVLVDMVRQARAQI